MWCIDFKGWFVTRDRRRCYPLTLIDAYSRYLIRCEGLLDPDGKEVRVDTSRAKSAKRSEPEPEPDLLG